MWKPTLANYLMYDYMGTHWRQTLQLICLMTH